MQDIKGETLIEQGNLERGTLAGQVVVVTGAGGGIGFEAARALLWLGTRVVVAEVDRRKGRLAAARLVEEWGPGAALFVRTDVGSERSAARLARRAIRAFGRVDAVINNATVAPLGAVSELGIRAWDRSYRVNLRGPALLARAFVPAMVERDAGAFVCVSSVGMAYMGAYESLKAAQVHLANTLDSELEGTGVSAFAIGPGFVPTETASSSIPRLAALMGKEEGELRASLQAHTLSIEAAGAGFAAAVALADRYRGLEISSVQALMDAGIDLTAGRPDATQIELSDEQWAEAAMLCRRVRTTLAEQYAGWQERNVFERGWMVRTFRQYARKPVQAWLALLEQLERSVEARDGSGVTALEAPLDALATYYAHLYELAEGYVRDPEQREEQLGIVRGWQEDVERLEALMRG